MMHDTEGYRLTKAGKRDKRSKGNTAKYKIDLAAKRGQTYEGPKPGDTHYMGYELVQVDDPLPKVS